MPPAVDDLLRSVLAMPESDRVAFAKSLRRSFYLFGIEVRFNGNEALCCYSGLPAGLNVHVYVEESGLLEMVVRHKTAEGRSDSVLKNIQPGDLLEIRFRRLESDPSREKQPSSMMRLGDLSRSSSDFEFQPAQRIAVEAGFESGENVRIACPEHGYFELVMSDAPFEYSRVFAAAGRNKERWEWHLPDLYPGQAMLLRVTQTDSTALFEQIG